MHEERVGAGADVLLAAAQGFVHAPSGDERFGPRDHGERRGALGVLGGQQLADELRDGRQLLLAVDEAVGLRKLLVLDTDARHTPLLQLAHETAHVVEVAVAGVAVEQDRQIARVGHEFERVDDLGPARFVVVAHAVLRGDREARRPDAAKTRFAHDARRQAVMGFHQEFELVAHQHLAQTRAA